MIRTIGLCKHYDVGGERVFALRNATAHISKGEFAAVTGPSGSGKSTFLNLIGCLEGASGGEYYLDGERVGDIAGGMARLRGEKLGFIFQSFLLIDHLTAVENVELPLYFKGIGESARREAAKRALDRVGLSDREKHLPKQLSGGQQQRVAVARALVTGAPLLLADEPTGNLDRESGQEVMRLLIKLNELGTTILLITHDDELAKLSGVRMRVEDGVLYRLS